MTKLVFISAEVNTRHPELVSAFRSDVDVIVIDGSETKDELKARVEAGK